MGILDVLEDAAKLNPLTGIPLATGKEVTRKRPKRQRITASELWVMAGGPESEAKRAGETAVGESHCRNSATSWTGCCHCIWQLYSDFHYEKCGYKSSAEMTKAIKKDPMACAKCAVKVWESSGWGAWEGTKYWGTGKDCKVSVTVDGDSLLDKAANAPGDAINGIEEVLGTVLKPLADFFKIITDADTWVRIGKVLLGAIIVLFAINALAGGPAGKAVRRLPGR